MSPSKPYAERILWLSWCIKVALCCELCLWIVCSNYWNACHAFQGWENTKHAFNQLHEFTRDKRDFNWVSEQMLNSLGVLSNRFNKTIIHQDVTCQIQYYIKRKMKWTFFHLNGICIYGGDLPQCTWHMCRVTEMTPSKRAQQSSHKWLPQMCFKFALMEKISRQKQLIFKVN